MEGSGGKRVVVDGSLVIRYGGEPRLANLKLVIGELKRRGYSPLTYLDATTRWLLEGNERDELEQMIKRGEVKQAPPGTEADYWMLRLLEREPDWLLLSNDLFRDYAEIFSCVRNVNRFIRFMIEGDRVQFGTFKDLKVRPSISSRLAHEMAAIAKNVSEKVAGEITKDFVERTSKGIAEKVLEGVSEESARYADEAYRELTKSKDFRGRIERTAREAAEEVVRKSAESYAKEAVAKILPKLEEEVIRRAERTVRDFAGRVSERIAREESGRALRGSVETVRTTAQETAREISEETVRRRIGEAVDEAARNAAEKTRIALERTIGDLAEKTAKEIAPDVVSRIAGEVVPETARRAVEVSNSCE